MAIEFHCPYCTAVIRVSDSAAGKRGSCPKCETKLIVPAVAGPAPPLSGGTNRAGSPVGADFVTGLSGVAMDTPSMSEKLRAQTRSRKSRGTYSLIVAAGCLLVIFAGIAGVLHFRNSPMGGTLRGAVAADLEFLPIRVSFDRLGMTPDERQQAVAAFGLSRETFVSSEMRCVVDCVDQQLEIRVAPQPGAVWYSVNPANQPELLGWISAHRKTVNRQRRASIALTGRELCQKKVALQGESGQPLDAGRYRDGFVLPSQVDALGFVVVALVENRLVPCAHEDSNGTLYFPLRAGTASFELRGRLINGEQLFPGRYKVHVDSGIVLPQNGPDEIPADGASPEDDGDWDPLDGMDDADMSEDITMTSTECLWRS